MTNKSEIEPITAELEHLRKELDNTIFVESELLFNPATRNLVILGTVIVGMITGGLFGWTLHFYIGG
jgi:hypothetical protein